MTASTDQNEILVLVGRQELLARLVSNSPRKVMGPTVPWRPPSRPQLQSTSAGQCPLLNAEINGLVPSQSQDVQNGEVAAGIQQHHTHGHKGNQQDISVDVVKAGKHPIL